MHHKQEQTLKLDATQGPIELSLWHGKASGAGAGGAPGLAARTCH